MTSFELKTSDRRESQQRDEPRRAYLEEGRRAVRAWMARRVRGPDPDAEMVTALRLGLVPDRLIRLWIAEDLFADPAMELAARAGYPELQDAFAELDRERRAAALQEQDRRAERDLRRAMAELGD